MVIDEKLLLEEKEKLTKEFNDLASKIKQVELNVGTMKANLNAINGAVQFATNLINMATNKEVVLKKVKKKTNEKI